MGLAAAFAGPGGGSAAGLLIAAGYAVAIAAADRRRWRAQDVAYGYHALREARWWRETGGPSPVGVRGRAETWLATHPAGTVPQLYRAVVAWHGGDATEAARERAALPQATAVDRARVEWLEVAQALDGGSVADTSRLREALTGLPEGAERTEMAAFLAQAESIGRHRVASADWLEPLADAPGVGAVRVPVRRRLRAWLVRFRLVLAFVVLAVVFATLVPTALAPRLPDAWSATQLATRGDVPAYDADAIDAALPALADAVAAASPVDAAPLDPNDLSIAIDDGLPSLIWMVGDIEFAGPPDARGEVWSIEVLAGARGDDLLLLTFDRKDGPAYRYRIDHAAATGIREALGVGG